MANNISQTAWADHLRGCAELATEIAGILGLHNGPERQACFATVAIDAKGHGVFLAPTPKDTRVNAEHTRTGVTHEPPPQRATPPVGEVVGESLGALRDPTPEQAEGANRGALLGGINSARELLAKEDPIWTPAYLNKYIQEKMKDTGKTQLGTLDVDELAILTEKLSKRLDVIRAAKRTDKKPEPTQAEKNIAAASDALDDWP